MKNDAKKAQKKQEEILEVKLVTNKTSSQLNTSCYPSNCGPDLPCGPECNPYLNCRPTEG